MKNRRGSDCLEGAAKCSHILQRLEDTAALGKELRLNIHLEQIVNRRDCRDHLELNKSRDCEPTRPRGAGAS